MSEVPSHEVLRLFVRPREARPLKEVDHLTVERGKGIVGDHAFGRLRHVTFVFLDDWKDALDALGSPVDPAERRANVLLSGGGARQYLKGRVRIGTVLVEIKGITHPCPVMDAAREGLKDALKPEGRAGIWGRVLEGGTIQRGDVLSGE